MSAELLTILTSRLDTEVHLSEWLEVTQQRINEFADATGDHQWIHVDPERAARESPWGTTIAHGYLTLSLYPLLRGLVDAAVPVHPGVRTVVNYGLNKTRFPAPVRAGARIRARSRLIAVEAVAGGVQATEVCSFEIEGESKPACVAEVIMRFHV